MKRLALVTVLLFAFFKSGNSLTCLQCDGITHPRHCRYVADCFEGEVCAVEMVKSSFGQHLYKVGCVSSSQCSNSSLQSDKCHECCNTNLCNSQGCGESGYPTERGPICYHCPAQVDVHSCNTIEFCETGEMCYYMEREEFGDMVYTGRCTSKHLCTASGFLGNVIVGRDLFFKTYQRSRSLKDTMCEGCCGFDLCNKNCNISNQDNCQASPCLNGQCFDTAEGFTCLCPAGVTGVRCEIARASDCYDIQHMRLGTSDGIYNITLPRNNKTIQVLCDLTTDGGGWTVFQNRFDGSVDFYRNFINYTSGFGNLTGEFWLGLDIIHEMTTQRLTELRIDLTAPNGTKGYEVFRNFSISEGPGYVLHNLLGTGTLEPPPYGNLSYHTGLDILYEMTTQQLTELRIDLTAANGNKGYEVYKNFSISEGPGYVLHNLPGTGTLEISSEYNLTYHTGQSFSTYDHDNDSDSGNCATYWQGAWWYNDCFYYNLNGRYMSPGTEDGTSMNYFPFTGGIQLSLRSSRMMFRVQH